MGENLALNMERNGRRVSVWNRTVPGVEEGVAERFVEGRAAGKQIRGLFDLSSLCSIFELTENYYDDGAGRQCSDELIDQVSPFWQRGCSDRRR